jgi:hypothetical protein
VQTKTDLLHSVRHTPADKAQPCADENRKTSCGDAWPQFMIVGAAKSGTTTLYRYLVHHPQIFLPKIKEPEFFSDDAVFSKGVDWYLSLFAEAKQNQMRGEASTTYTRWPHTADAATRIHELVPSVKLIYIMRHPVERAYAHYAHHMRLKVTMTFEEALSRSSIYLDCSMYMRQIDRYLRYFSGDSFLFVTLDELKDAPNATLQKLQTFLGIEPLDLLRDGPIHSNERHAEFIHHHTTGHFRRIPGGSFVANSLPQGWRDRIYSWLAKSLLGTYLKNRHSIPPMLEKTRASLLQHFGEPNRQLAEFLNRDLSNWNH